MNSSLNSIRIKLRESYMKYVNPAFSCGYVLIAPAAVLCLAFSIIPTFLVIRNSFCNVDYVSNTDTFVGLANYRSILTDPVFLMVFRNTIVFTFFTVAIGIPLAILVALFLNKNNTIYNVIQGIVFAPHIISYVSIAVLWMFLMDPQFGILNYVLSWFGIAPLNWMLSQDTSLLSIIIVAIWKTMGYNVMIVLAGLQGVPRDVYEAAKLDRSGRVKTFFHITLPMISPTFVFMVTTGVIISFSAFDIVRLMTRGGFLLTVPCLFSI